MKTFIRSLALALMVSSAGLVYAQTPTAVSYEALTVSTTAVPVTAGVLRPAAGAVSTCTFSVETADIRFLFEGTTPTASVGILASAGQSFRLSGLNNLDAFRAIRSGGTNASVVVICSRGTSSNPSPLDFLAAPPSTVDLSGAMFSGNSAASATGAAVPTDAGYTGINVGGTLVGLTAGQATMANSIPVVLASNQASVPVAATLTAETTKVIGTINVAAAQTIGVTGTLTAVTAITNALPVGNNNIGDIDVASIAAGDNDIGNVDLEIAGTAIAVNAGTASAQTLRTVTASDSPDNVSLDNVESYTSRLLSSAAPITAGAATATTSLVAGGQYNLTPPTFTDGQQGSIQLSSDGSLKVTGGGGGTEYVVNAVAPANPTGGTFVMERDDALSALTEVEGDWTNPRSDANGALWVTIAGAPAISGTVTANAGTNLNTSALLTTTAHDAVFGTAGTADTQVMSVQGIASMTPILATLSGTNTVTTVTTVGAVTAITNALPAGTNNIGDVDILTFPDNEPFNIAQMNGVTVLMGNGASGTGAQRVTIANDSTGILAAVTNVATIGTSVTPGTAATNLGKAVDSVAGATDTGVALLVVRDDALTTLTPADGDYTTLRVSSTGALHVTGAAGTTQYVEDAAATDGASLVAIGGIRRDTTPSSSAGTAGDNATVTLDANGRLYTNTTLYDAAGAALTVGVDYTQDAALTVATTAGPMTMGRASAAAPTNVSTGDDAVMAWYLLNGSAVTNIAAGGTLITATSTSLNVACTTGCSGGTQYAEDTAHVTADLVTMAGAVRQDTKGTGIGANGDITNLYVNSVGELWTAGSGQVAHDAVATAINPVLVGGYASQAAPSDVTLDGDSTRIWTLRNGSLVANLAAGGTLITATGAALNVSSTITTFPDNEPFNVAQINGVTPLMGAGATGTGSLRVTISNDDDVSDAATLFEANLVAHDAADAGSPLKVGYHATTSISGNTMVATNDRTDAYAGIDGVAISRPYANLEDRVSGVVGVTDGSSTSLIAAQGAGIRFCATTLIVSNSSATNVTLDLRDGTAGAVLATIPAAANMGGGVVPLLVPLCTTANTIFAMDPSAAATTVTVTAVGFKTKL